jgi:beta-catenin-like protein 1
LIENCTSISQPSVPKISTIFLDYLLTRLSKPPFDSIRGYTAEILSILVQDESSRSNITSKALDTILPILAYYRKRDPKDKDEVEMVENLFDCLIGISLHDYKIVVEQEGLELMLIIIREGKMAMMRAWGVLETVMKGRREDVCKRCWL